MTRPLKETNFYLMPDGIWKDMSGRILADVLAEYDIIVDDRTRFARLYDYERGICIYYRVWGGRIQITLWPIDRK